MPLEVRRLSPEDDRSRFRTTYIAVDGAGGIAGYVTVAASELSPVSMPATKRKHLPKYPIPILRLARLAVAASAQGQGAGSLLVRAVLALAQQMAASAGCDGIVVDAKPEAAAFYRKLGFVQLDLVGGELGDRPLPQVMFLELGQLSAAT